MDKTKDEDRNSVLEEIATQMETDGQHEIARRIRCMKKDSDYNVLNRAIDLIEELRNNDSDWDNSYWNQAVDRCAFVVGTLKSEVQKELDILNELASTIGAKKIGFKDLSDWRLENSSGRSVLMYKNSNVIESEDAEYVLSLIHSDRNPRTYKDSDDFHTNASSIELGAWQRGWDDCKIFRGKPSIAWRSKTLELAKMLGSHPVGYSSHAKSWSDLNDHLANIEFEISDDNSKISDPLSDFQEGQWWIKELDNLVNSGNLTNNQVRAVAVVHNMLRASNRLLDSSNTPDVSHESHTKPVDHIWIKCPRGHGCVTHQHFDYCGVCEVCHERMVSCDAPAESQNDVTKILLRVVPGYNGEGVEVYAKSLSDVIDHMNSLSQELEEWQLGIRKLPSTDCKISVSPNAPSLSIDTGLDHG